jgi:hypothetical protein
MARSKWTTVTFIQAFLHGKLGKKRVHGTYRVLDGDHCKVLVRASTQYGKPSGNNLIALNISSNTESVSFFHYFNTSCFTYRMNKDLDIYSAPRLPIDILGGNDPHLLNSGIIDFNDNEVLVEIGDTPYLLHKRKDNDNNILKWESNIRFSVLDKIPARVATISEAKELIKDPPGAEQLCDIWWAHKQPAGFRPPTLDDVTVGALSTPVNPLDHGYTLDDCSILKGGSTGLALQTLIPDKRLQQEPHDHRATSYLAAKKCWNDACDTVRNRAPLDYKGLTIQKDKYGSLHSVEERTGRIIRIPSGVFMEGVVINKDDYDTQQRLDGWYKLDSKTTRIKLP